MISRIFFPNSASKVFLEFFIVKAKQPFFIFFFQCEEILFCFVLGAVYIFSFFNAKEERTRYKYLIFYTFCFCENSAMILIWFFYANSSIWYYYPGIIGHYLAFFAGLFFMVIYYLYFHPTGVDVPFLSKKRQKSDVVRPIELSTVQPLSASTPVLSEEPPSKTNRERVQRTLSEPPAEPTVRNQCTRSWKTMQR